MPPLGFAAFQPEIDRLVLEMDGRRLILAKGRHGQRCEKTGGIQDSRFTLPLVSLPRDRRPHRWVQARRSAGNRRTNR